MKRLTEIEKVVLNNKSNELRKTVEFNIISGKVKRHYSLTDEQLNVRSRKRALALSRHIIFHLTYKHTKGISQSVVGNIYDRDHATVNHSTKVIGNLTSYDKGLVKFLSEIETAVLKYKRRKIITKKDVFRKLLKDVVVGEQKNVWNQQFELAK